MSKEHSPRPTQFSDDAVDQQLAHCHARLRELRASRGWTLDELAERSGLSKPYLSRLEAGDRNPSIAAILTLSRVFSISLGELFEAADDQDANVVVVRGHAAPLQTGQGLEYAALSNASRFRNLQPIRLKISAKRTGDERYQHEGEEWVYVLTGSIRLQIGPETHELSEGDAAHFRSDQPHRLTALGGRDAEVIVVACPLPETPQPQRRRRLASRRAVR